MFVLCLPFVEAGDIKARLDPATQLYVVGQNNIAGLNDQGLCVVGQNPLEFVTVMDGIVNGRKAGGTVLYQGSTFETAQPVGSLIEPSHRPGAYDETYAGSGAALRINNVPHIFFHAERPTGGKNSEGIPRFYASIGLAIATDGHNFKKVGPVITGKPIDPNWKGTAQGNGDPSVCIDATGEWIYCYYTEHSRFDPLKNQIRSVITCLARSRVKDGGKPGTWTKYYNGSFQEPGLGGKDSEVANCWAPFVVYLPNFKRYVMVGGREGVVLFTSVDGIHWGEKTQLIKMADIPLRFEQFVIHPSLYFDVDTPTQAKGYLFYGYGQPGQPGRVMKQPIVLEK
jgi:hypothetical protein